MFSFTLTLMWLLPTSTECWLLLVEGVQKHDHIRGGWDHDEMERWQQISRASTTTTNNSFCQLWVQSSDQTCFCADAASSKIEMNDMIPIAAMPL